MNGEYVATGSDDVITINKKLTIKSTNGATLDGKKKSSIFSFGENAAGSKVTNIKFVNGYGHLGAAMNIHCNDLTVSDCDFESNSVDYRAGAVYIYGKNVIFSKCVFNKNKAADVGGALYADYDGLKNSALVVKYCNFTYNTAVVSAGAVIALSNNSKISNCIFNHNSVKNDGDCYGGAIQIGLDTHNSHGNVYNSVFSYNKAVSTSNGESHGGAGCVRNGSSYYNCTFNNNVADYGAALTYHADGTIKNCTFISNTANKYGGAIAIRLLHKNMNLNIIKCIFKSNKAPYGGAIKLSGKNIKIQSSTFTNNHASIDGAAINIEATNVTVTNSKFNKNIAENDGGAIFIIIKNTQIKG